MEFAGGLLLGVIVGAAFVLFLDWFVEKRAENKRLEKKRKGDLC